MEGRFWNFLLKQDNDIFFWTQSDHLPCRQLCSDYWAEEGIKKGDTARAATGDTDRAGDTTEDTDAAADTLADTDNLVNSGNLDSSCNLLSYDNLVNSRNLINFHCGFPQLLGLVRLW